LQPPKHPRKVSIAIPASLVSDTPHLREKTFKIGLIGRAAAIFRVDEIIVYPDMQKIDQIRDMNLIAKILNYIETPQYLRKRLFPFEKSLSYVGILPPLRTPHHPMKNKLSDIKPGSYREGVIIESDAKGSMIDVGVEKPVSIDEPNLPVGKRVTVKITKTGDGVQASLAKNEEIGIYWGFNVTVSKLPLGRLVKDRGFDLVIATSRYGVSLYSASEEIEKRWKVAKSVLVAFGSPTEGLKEILLRERLKLEETANFTVNTIPAQGTETVRTEEAVYASLATLSLLINE